MTDEPTDLPRAGTDDAAADTAARHPEPTATPQPSPARSRASGSWTCPVSSQARCARRSSETWAPR